MALAKIRAGFVKIQEELTHKRGKELLKEILQWADIDENSSLDVSEFMNNFGSVIRRYGEATVSDEELKNVFYELTSSTKEDPGTLSIDVLCSALMIVSENDASAVTNENQKVCEEIRKSVEEAWRVFNLKSTMRLFRYVDINQSSDLDEDEFVDVLVVEITGADSVVSEKNLRALFSSLLCKGNTKLDVITLFVGLCPKLEEDSLIKIKEAFTDETPLDTVSRILNMYAETGRLISQLLRASRPPRRQVQFAIDFLTCMKVEDPEEFERLMRRI